MRLASIVIALQGCFWASHSLADSGYTFLRATCAGSINYFEVLQKDISNIDGGPTLFAKLKSEARLFVIDEPAAISCLFDDGTLVKFVSEPNGADDRHPSPGSRVTITINGKPVVRNVSFASDCPDHTLRAIEIDHNLDRAVRLFIEKTHEGSVMYGEPPLFGRVEYSRPYDDKADPLWIRNCYK
jgi:hypothetical protein